MRTAPRSVVSRLLLLALLTAPVVAYACPTAAEVKKALKSGDQATVTSTLEGVRGQLDGDLVKAIIDAAPRLKTLGVYDALVAALGTASGEALQELIKGYERQRRGDLRFLVVDALGKCSDLAAERTLLTALQEDEDESIAVLAARALGRRATASAVEALIPILKQFEGDARRGRLVREINGALGALTGQDLSVADDWKNYWDAHKAEYRAPAAPNADGGSQTADRNAIDRMRRERPADLRTMERMRDDDVLVVKSDRKMDFVENVLRKLEVKHRLVERAEFEAPALELDPTRQTVVLQCPGKGDAVRMGDATIAKLREFVGRGGYLITSDLQLGYTLERAFPDVVQSAGFTSNKPDTVPITISPHPEAVNHPLMRDVFPLNGTWTSSPFSWQLFQQCEIVRPNAAITELVVSEQMGQLGSSNVVAFTFTYPPTPGGGGRQQTGGGGGRRRPQGGVVLHVLSHWKLQENDSGDGFALQQILLNMIVDKQDRRRAEAAGGN